MEAFIVLGTSVIGLIFFTTLSRYIRCPSDKILVIFDKKGNQPQIMQCIHGDAAFVWPVIQDYAFLDLTPNPYDIELQDTRTKDGFGLEGIAQFVVCISLEKKDMPIAAKRLLPLSRKEIRALEEVLLSTLLRKSIIDCDSSLIKNDRIKFDNKIELAIKKEFSSLGLELANCNLNKVKLA